jgi:plastocyanin
MGNSVLAGVAAISANDVWAVGYTSTRTLVEHWDGVQWSIVGSPNVGSGVNGLNAIEIVSPNDMWAVGSYYVPASNKYQTLVEHWNGGGWSVVASPNIGTGSNFLWKGVTAVSANDVWAVGSYGPITAEQTLAIRWNGSQWNVVPTANMPGNANRLYDVVATASNDVWAVGYYGPNPNERTLVEHWDGAQWSIVASPNPDAGRNVLIGVATLASNDVWAGGFRGTSTLTEHWDGTQWSVVSSPNRTGANYLEALAALSTYDILAVGSYNFNNNQKTLALHYVNVAPGCPTATQTPTRTATATPTIGCAVGIRYVIMGDYYYLPTNVTVTVGTTIRWLNEGPSQHTTTSDTNIWDSSVLNPGQTYDHTFNTPGTYPYHCTLHPQMVGSITVLGGCTPTAIPTLPTSTPTSIPTSTHTRTGTPTNMPTVPAATSTPTSTSTLTPTITSTRTAVATQTPSGTTATSEPSDTTTATPRPSNTRITTPTTCPIQFTDVPEGSTFYPYVRCMSCRGVISGYTSGCETGNPCFRPGNNVTRGQLAKIVANAAGFSEPAGAQQYEDVSPGTTFFDYIWRLADRGYVTGYPCGGPGEPCVAPGNLPYFRPNGNATRGQISKIVANAAGFIEPHTRQTFQDVPIGSTFYDFIERLASRGVMSGYPCGGPGEPCIPPDNRPYFRPANLASRGQTAKIVANAFYPNCYTPSR